jgi:hypothetical protein
VIHGLSAWAGSRAARTTGIVEAKEDGSVTGAGILEITSEGILLMVDGVVVAILDDGREASMSNFDANTTDCLTRDSVEFAYFFCQLLEHNI